jgi:predicted CXXCH cytochrome family protein
MKRPGRFVFSFLFALLAAGVTLIVAQAQTPQPVQPPMPLTNDNCISCHKDIANVWMSGFHGQAGTDPVFSEAWNTQGKPGACLVCHTTGYDPATGSSQASSVACTACHSPVSANHPKEKMPIDSTPDLCGKCHSDPRFATQDWQLSAHYQRGMSCSMCHDPHTAGMKTVGAALPARADASALCENCHKDAMKNFPTSTHAQAGVTCVNCHLGFNVGTQLGKQTDFVTSHSAPDHKFMPSVSTCTACHANQMHAPGQALVAAAIKSEQSGGTPTPEPTPVATPIPLVTKQSAPVSPAGFSGLAGLLGLAGGMVLQPWLEKLYRRVNGRKGGKNE